MIKNRNVQIIYLSIVSILGLLGTVASVGTFDDVFYWDFYVYFTNLSNYFCIGLIIAGLISAIRKKEDSYINVAPILYFMGLVAILITFLVFNILLAPSRSLEKNLSINSILLHVVIPILYILAWFLFYERKKVNWKYPFISILFPLIYIIFIFIHAAIFKFDASIPGVGTNDSLIYPYFFLNISENGIPYVLLWLFGFFVSFTSIGYMYFGLDKITFKKK